MVAQNRLVGISTPKVLRIKLSSFYLDTFTFLLMYQIIFVVLLSLWMEIQDNWFLYGTAGKLNQDMFSYIVSDRAIVGN